MNEKGTGTLYLCATPIGNLGDITLRVLETLRTVDLIAAEDTRNTLKLLNHYEIHKPMTSYHEHNKYEKAEELLGRLQRGRASQWSRMRERRPFPIPERCWRPCAWSAGSV